MARQTHVRFKGYGAAPCVQVHAPEVHGALFHFRFGAVQLRPESSWKRKRWSQKVHTLYGILNGRTKYIVELITIRSTGLLLIFACCRQGG